MTNFKERIVEILGQHSEGLTVVEIAKALGFHRQTVTKYVGQLLKENMISQREIGKARLCYLRCNYARKQ